MSVKDDWWGPLSTVQRLPEPVELLQNQGVALSKRTEGRLYGEVIDSGVPTVNSLEFNFYLGVQDKPYRNLLFSIRCSTPEDYPVTITSTYAQTVEQAIDKDEFENKVRLILTSPMTQDLIQKLLSVSPLVTR